MVFDSDVLNLPLEWAEGLGNRWARFVFTFLGIFLWVIPLTLIFITPLLLWNALMDD